LTIVAALHLDEPPMALALVDQREPVVEAVVQGHQARIDRRPQRFERRDGLRRMQRVLHDARVPAHEFAHHVEGDPRLLESLRRIAAHERVAPFHQRIEKMQ